MKSLIQRTGLLLQLLSLALLLSCGGGGGGDGSGGGGTPSSSSPQIDTLSYSPKAAYVGSTLQVQGSFGFSDPDGDLAVVVLTIKDGSGATLSSQTIPARDAQGLKQGVLTGTVIAGTAAASTYTFEVYVMDAAGHPSNVLSGSIRIAEYPWTAKAPDPQRREYTASASLGGLLYVMGGQRTDAGVVPAPATAAVNIYDALSNTWTSAPALPTARMGLVAGVVGGKLYAIGGATEGFTTAAVGTVEAYDPATSLWTTRASMPTPRAFAASAVVNGLIYVVGGEDQTGNTLGTLEVYDPVGDTWSTRTALPTPRTRLRATALGAHVYAVGGYGGLLTQWVGSVEMFSTGGNTWSSPASMPTPRSQFGLVEYNGTLLAAGGENVARSLDVLEVFDAATGTWSVKSPSPVAFTRASAGAAGAKLYFFADGTTLQYDPANEIR